jgi:hypothetical protein
MKFRTLLLGTAAAFGMAGGAQAADLAVAEAIDYVKVCDAYGAGYYYIPGTDTCLRIGGHVQLDVWFYDDDVVGNIIGHEVIIPDVPPGSYPVSVAKDTYSASWEFKTEANANFTARTMSDLGPVVTHFTFVSVSNNNDIVTRGFGDGKTVRLDNAYGSIGPLLFGWTNSTFDYGGGFTYDGSIRSDKKVDQIRWSYMMGSWGLIAGLEDPRDRYDPNAKNATGDFPDIILAITGGGGGWDWKLAGAVTDRTSGTGWAVQLGVTGDLGGGFKLRAQAAYADNAPSYVGVANCVGLCGDEGAWWSALISASVALSGNVSAAATLSYADGPVNGDEQWQGAIGAYWAATSTSEIGLEVLYKDFGSLGPSSSWGVHGRFKTYFGG